MRLLESGKIRSRATLQTTASGLLHAAVIGSAVYATAGAAPGVQGTLRDTSMVYLPRHLRAFQLRHRRLSCP